VTRSCLGHVCRSCVCLYIYTQIESILPARCTGEGRVESLTVVPWCPIPVAYTHDVGACCVSQRKDKSRQRDQEKRGERKGARQEKSEKRERERKSESEREGESESGSDTLGLLTSIALTVVLAMAAMLRSVSPVATK
jgi:hypothetical protein